MFAGPGILVSLADFKGLAILQKLLEVPLREFLDVLPGFLRSLDSPIIQIHQVQNLAHLKPTVAQESFQ